MKDSYQILVETISELESEDMKRIEIDEWYEWNKDDKDKFIKSWRIIYSPSWTRERWHVIDEDLWRAADLMLKLLGMRVYRSKDTYLNAGPIIERLRKEGTSND